MRYSTKNNTCNPNRNQSSASFLFNDFLGDVAVAMKNMEKNQNVNSPSIRTNIQEVENGFSFSMALPGVTKDQISLDINDTILKLSVAPRTEEDHKKYSFKEFDYSGAKRSFKLSKAIDVSTVSAEMTDGILTITMSKKPAFVPKSITIK